MFLATVQVPSQKPTQPPAFDAATFVKVLDGELKKDDGSSYAVFQDNSYPRYTRWINGTAEFDGKGLRDVVAANAVMLDDVKGDGDRNSQAIADLREDVRALQEAPVSRPFP